MKHKIIKLPIYAGKLGIVLASEPKDLLKIFDSDSVKESTLLEDDELFMCTCLLLKDDWKCTTIILNVDHDLPLTHGTIAHEALHAVNIVFSYCSVEYSLDLDEHAAYFLGFIVDEVYKMLAENNIEIYAK